MAKREKRPSWFKLWMHHMPLIEAVTDQVAGRVIKAAFHYFSTGEILPLDALEAVVFASVKADIDEANADYQRDVENGKKRNRSGAIEEKPETVREGEPPSAPLTEGEGEGEGEGDREGDREGEGEEERKEGDREGEGEEILFQAAKPPARTQYGPYHNVLFSDEEYAKLRADYPRDYGERIERLSEYIASTGKKYRNHLATIRRWAKQDVGKVKPQYDYGGEDNWTL